MKNRRLDLKSEWKIKGGSEGKVEGKAEIYFFFFPDFEFSPEGPGPILVP